MLILDMIYIIIVLSLSNFMFFILGRLSVVLPEKNTGIKKFFREDGKITFHNPIKLAETKEILKDIASQDE